MAGLGDFILTICAASAVSALLNAVMCDGTMKKYVNLLISLVILLVLLSPLKGLHLIETNNISEVSLQWDTAEVFAKANSIVARRIGTAVSEKFSVAKELVSCEYNDTGVIIRLPKRIGIVKDDVRLFVANRFGVLAEVELYE